MMKSAILTTVVCVTAAGAAVTVMTAPEKENPQMKFRSPCRCPYETASCSKGGEQATCLTPEEIKERAKNLTPDERRIILEKGTERAFTGELYKNKRDGVYTCKLCGAPLFSSETKYESGSGWPSFYKAMDDEAVGRQTDRSAGMVRTEITCSHCGGHLGHVFDDGPQPTGERYCVNSASLDFMTKEEYSQSEATKQMSKQAYFAGGCFWGVEDRFQKTPGVLDATSGYMGGSKENPDYKLVCSGTTGHAETVRVTYDPQKVTYGELLAVFFKLHDPTQVNRQGPDYGTQYRSAVFAADEEQLREAREFVEKLAGDERFKGRKIATQVEPAQTFYEAEEYHQNYHAKHGGSCAMP